MAKKALGKFEQSRDTSKTHVSDSIIINLSDYLARWENDYIVYHSSHFAEKYGDLDRANQYFNYKYQEQVAKMGDSALADQMNQLIVKQKSLLNRTKVGPEIYNRLQQGGLLEQTMDEIARSLNEAIQRNYQQGTKDSFDTLLYRAQHMSHMLENPNQSQKNREDAINKFFNLTIEGLKMAGKINAGTLEAFTGLGQKILGDSGYSFALSSNNRGIKGTNFISQEDKDMCERVVKYLTEATNKYLEGGGKLSHTSFSSTITNIFSNAIGERLSQVMIQKIVHSGQVEFEDILVEKLGGQLQANKNAKFTLGGRRKDISNRVSKVDVFGNNAFRLTVNQPESDGKVHTYQIEIAINTSVKWYKAMGENSSIHLVAGSPLGSYFTSGTRERYLAYNVIAHRWHGGKQADKEAGAAGSVTKYHEAFRVLRAATSATFFNEWMTGTGQAISTLSGQSRVYNNKVQFLMVNGKIYSVMRIIRNICNELMERNSWDAGADMPIKMSITNGQYNYWVGSRSPNVADAMRRSALVNEVMNKLEISASLNSNILTKYAY